MEISREGIIILSPVLKCWCIYLPIFSLEKIQAAKEVRNPEMRLLPHSPGCWSLHSNCFFMLSVPLDTSFPSSLEVQSHWPSFTISLLACSPFTWYSYSQLDSHCCVWIWSLSWEGSQHPPHLVQVPQVNELETSKACDCFCLFNSEQCTTMWKSGNRSAFVLSPTICILG